MEINWDEVDAAMSRHVADIIHFDDFGTPAEVCRACSRPEDGLWVPAPFCNEAKLDMEKRVK
jgi:hypothetical protein